MIIYRFLREKGINNRLYIYFIEFSLFSSSRSGQNLLGNVKCCFPLYTVTLLIKLRYVNVIN